MLRLTPFEIFARLIPEVLILIFAAYAFSLTKFDKKKYIISVIILGICVFTVRILPINYGVHTILNIIALTIIATCINKIETIGAIRSSITTTILLFVLEGINVVFLKLTMADRLEEIVADSTLKTIYTLPSILGLLVIALIYYNVSKKKGKLNDV